MITEAENIILSKEYFELSTDELATVSELVENAEEFDEMKWFLANTQGVIAQEKIEATPELKKKVMAHLNQSEDKRKFWLNGIIPFFLPEDKKFYQKPAFQMGLVALVVVGFLLFIPTDIDSGAVAMNEKSGELKEFEGNKGNPEPEGELSVIDELNLEEDAELNQQRNSIDDKIHKLDANEVELIEEAPTVVDPMMDGFYTGDLSDDDLKKMEDRKNQNSANNGVNPTVDVITTLNPSDGKLKDKTDLKQDLGGVVNADNNVSNNGDSNKGNAVGNDNAPGANLATTSTLNKKAKDKSKTNRFDREKKEKDEFEDVDLSLADFEMANEDAQIAGGSFDIQTDSISTNNDQYNNIVLTESNTESAKIIAYKFHVDETKELKKLFTVFK
jgi:hypothetical protein